MKYALTLFFTLLVSTSFVQTERYRTFTIEEYKLFPSGSYELSVLGYADNIYTDEVEVFMAVAGHIFNLLDDRDLAHQLVDGYYDLLKSDTIFQKDFKKY